MPVAQFTVTKAANGAGWSTVTAIPELKGHGKIMRVVISEDATNKDATSVDFYIADKAADSGGVWTSAPSPHNIVYKQAALAVAGEGNLTTATTVALDDNVALDGGSIYHSTQRVSTRDTGYYAGFNALLVGGGGTGTYLYVSVYYEDLSKR